MENFLITLDIEQILNTIESIISLGIFGGRMQKSDLFSLYPSEFLGQFPKKVFQWNFRHLIILTRLGGINGNFRLYSEKYIRYFPWFKLQQTSTDSNIKCYCLCGKVLPNEI